MRQTAVDYHEHEKGSINGLLDSMREGKGTPSASKEVAARELVTVAKELLAVEDYADTANTLAHVLRSNAVMRYLDELEQEADVSGNAKVIKNAKIVRDLIYRAGRVLDLVERLG